MGEKDFVMGIHVGARGADYKINAILGGKINCAHAEDFHYFQRGRSIEVCEKSVLFLTGDLWRTQ
jgi:hypothetical protein